MKAHPKMSVREMVEMLKEHGIKRGKDWVHKRRGELGIAQGVSTSSD